MTIRKHLANLFHTAMQSAGIPETCLPHIVPGKKAAFGDYQANGAMAAAKVMGSQPRKLAQLIVDHLAPGDMIDTLEVAGPGFINIHLNNGWLGEQIAAFRRQPEQAIKTTAPQTIVLDYSSPNLAKEMHVGHLRSTIIGDALARILEKQGHHVIRQNHVGDWGTQFGMLLAELEDHLKEGETASLALSDLEAFYQQAKRHFDASADFAQKARDYVVKLQSGDDRLLALWAQFKATSFAHSQAIYEQLNVTLTERDVRGESAYNDDLATLVVRLKAQQLAVEDGGATVVFLEELADKEGNPSPVIVRKQGGGFLYATTDLAAIRYRNDVLQADRILYFIDARQSLHMQQVFTLARKAGLVKDTLSLEHHPFGTMMGGDGKPFKTRGGGTVKLADLLAEAVARAETLVRQKNTGLTEDEYREIGRKVGIGAIKYADLAKTRTHDYVFDWNAMLSFEGNTAPYLQYAYTRIRSIFRKAGVSPEAMNGAITLHHEDEKAIAIKLLQFPEVLEQVSVDAYPPQLCHYLYNLASDFMRFYENCPILKEGVRQEEKTSRLQLCDASAVTLKLGLELLGIETMEKM